MSTLNLEFVIALTQAVTALLIVLNPLALVPVMASVTGGMDIRLDSHESIARQPRHHRRCRFIGHPCRCAIANSNCYWKTGLCVPEAGGCRFAITTYQSADTGRQTEPASGVRLRRQGSEHLTSCASESGWRP